MIHSSGDLPGWAAEVSRNFSVKSAYQLRAGSSSGVRGQLWILDEARRALSLRSFPCSVSPDVFITRTWCKPSVDWIKFNTDGARDPDSEATFCGGVG
ncbi:hypothetical protein V6N12_064477 [Hibiscus sabdariffa]|uniref:Uncharacterized protein n=1 Tax=Hibiscus sabdariffa TaxID=183260 RepID=A0ABR2G687_9ROSI